MPDPGVRGRVVLSFEDAIDSTVIDLGNNYRNQGLVRQNNSVVPPSSACVSGRIIAAGVCDGNIVSKFTILQELTVTP